MSADWRRPKLSRRWRIRAGDQVLDLGSGIGGPWRHLAASIGCHVTGIDLTEEYCKITSMLAESTGLPKDSIERSDQRRDRTLKAVAGRAAAPGFGLQTIMGPEFGGMAKNLVGNLTAGTCRVLEAVYAK